MTPQIYSRLLQAYCIRLLIKLNGKSGQREHLRMKRDRIRLEAISGLRYKKQLSVLLSHHKLVSIAHAACIDRHDIDAGGHGDCP